MKLPLHHWVHRDVLASVAQSLAQKLSQNNSKYACTVGEGECLYCLTWQCLRLLRQGILDFSTLDGTFEFCPLGRKLTTLALLFKSLVSCEPYCFLNILLKLLHSNDQSPDASIHARTTRQFISPASPDFKTLKTFDDNIYLILHRVRMDLS